MKFSETNPCSEISLYAAKITRNHRKEVGNEQVCSMHFIPPTSLEKGDYITVHSPQKGHDRSFLGDVLEVKVVSLPYLIVTRYTHGSRSCEWKVDTREYNFIGVTDDYLAHALKTAHS